jgi:hypothetical protein
VKLHSKNISAHYAGTFAGAYMRGGRPVPSRNVTALKFAAAAPLSSYDTFAHKAGDFYSFLDGPDLARLTCVSTSPLPMFSSHFFLERVTTRPPSSSFQTDILMQTRRFKFTMPVMRGFKSAVAQLVHQYHLVGWIRWSSFLGPSTMILECLVQGSAFKLSQLDLGQVGRDLALELSGGEGITFVVEEEELVGKLPNFERFDVGRTPSQVLDVASRAHDGSLRDGSVSNGSASVENTHTPWDSAIWYPYDLAKRVESERSWSHSTTSLQKKLIHDLQQTQEALAVQVKQLQMTQSLPRPPQPPRTLLSRLAKWLSGSKRT